MNLAQTTEELWPSCPLWQAAARQKARQRRELAALPPAEAQARITHHLPPGGARLVAAQTNRLRGLLGLASILAGNDERANAHERRSPRLG